MAMPIVCTAPRSHKNMNTLTNTNMKKNAKPNKPLRARPSPRLSQMAHGFSKLKDARKTYGTQKGHRANTTKYDLTKTEGAIYLGFIRRLMPLITRWNRTVQDNGREGCRINPFVFHVLACYDHVDKQKEAWINYLAGKEYEGYAIDIAAAEEMYDLMMKELTKLAMDMSPGGIPDFSAYETDDTPPSTEDLTVDTEDDDMFTPSHAERRKARGNSSKRRFDLESESEMDEEEEEPAPTPRKTLSRQVKKGKSPVRKSPKNKQ